MNGVKLLKENACKESIKLGTMDYCVLSLEVICPSDIHYETDFLARAASVGFSGLVNTIKNGVSISFKLDVESEFFDESYIWDYYMELPGGLVLLRP